MDHSLQRGVRGILRGRAVNSRALPHAIIQQERVRQLNEKDVGNGDYVLYWMQAAQRPSKTTPSSTVRGQTNSVSGCSWCSG